MAHGIGPEHGRLLLRTSRQGLAAQVGHDLVIEVTRWSGEVDEAEGTVAVTAEVGSLTVLSGSGGVKPLSDRDKREIAQNARRILRVDQHPRAVFTGTGEGPGVLTLLGIDRPLRLEITDLGERRYRATGRVLQSDYGIKPYTALLGALRLADAVDVTAEVELR